MTTFYVYSYLVRRRFDSREACHAIYQKEEVLVADHNAREGIPQAPSPNAAIQVMLVLEQLGIQLADEEGFRQLRQPRRHCSLVYGTHLQIAIAVLVIVATAQRQLSPPPRKCCTQF